MAGASDSHVTIALNLGSLLRAFVRVKIARFILRI